MATKSIRDTAYAVRQSDGRTRRSRRRRDEEHRLKK